MKQGPFGLSRMCIHSPCYSLELHQVLIWYTLEGLRLNKCRLRCVCVCEHVYTTKNPQNRLWGELASLFLAGIQTSLSGWNLGRFWDKSFRGFPSLALWATHITTWDPSWFLLLRSKGRTDVGCLRSLASWRQSCHHCWAAWGYAGHWPVTFLPPTPVPWGDTEST